MKQLSFLVLALLTLPLTAQTVYYNHPKGVSIGSYRFPTQVAKLTLPAGTYHVVSKIGLNDQSFYPGVSPGVSCFLVVTGIPSVPSPFTADAAEVTLVTSTDGIASRRGIMVLETAFTTAGGTIKVICDSGAPGPYNVISEFINLSATKISTLIRQ